MNNIEQLRQRYENLCHAMQSGVAFKMDREPAETNPKHLRVGVNSAMVQTSALARLLMEKGVFTEEEYWEILCQVMQEEVELYRQSLSELYGANIELV